MAKTAGAGQKNRESRFEVNFTTARFYRHKYRLYLFFTAFETALLIVEKSAMAVGNNNGLVQSSLSCWQYSKKTWGSD
ncbi:MAG: hypothetical protein LBT47_03375 [Deltaproteobacteria bacterium]|nr:hypothetical protein [Deltaproteobacteria bacterium]